MKAAICLSSASGWGVAVRALLSHVAVVGVTPTQKQRSKS
jgi:hypothetical protein